MNTAEPGLVGALTSLIPLISLKFWDKSDETGIFIWIGLEVSVIYSVVEIAENSFMIKVGRAFYFKVMANHSECMDKDQSWISMSSVEENIKWNILLPQSSIISVICTEIFCQVCFRREIFHSALLWKVRWGQAWGNKPKCVYRAAIKLTKAAKIMVCSPHDVSEVLRFTPDQWLRWGPRRLFSCSIILDIVVSFSIVMRVCFVHYLLARWFVTMPAWETSCFHNGQN